MTEQYIRVGSVVLDRARNKPLRVVGKDHRIARDHPNVQVDDAMARQWGVTPEDTVFDCVFLPTGDDAVTAPRKVYAYPEARLTRYPVEAALPDDARRIHTQILIEAFAAVLSKADEEGPSVRENVERAIAFSDIQAEIPGEILLEEAVELSSANDIRLDGGLDHSTPYWTNDLDQHIGSLIEAWTSRDTGEYCRFCAQEHVGAVDPSERFCSEECEEAFRTVMEARFAIGRRDMDLRGYD